MSPAQPPSTPFSFTIQAGEQLVSLSGSLPDGACPITEIIPLLLNLGESIVAAAIQQSDKTVSCGPGCGACCRQLVPISLAEAAYLRLVVLPELEPNNRQRIAERFASAAAALESAALLAPLHQLPTEPRREERQALGLRYFHLGIPCPFLEQESCSIHPMRPLACREYLVTSPAANCARPGKASVALLPIPTKPSQALIQMDAAATGSPGWQTMITALLEESITPARTVTQPLEFLKNFLSHLLNPC